MKSSQLVNNLFRGLLLFPLGSLLAIVLNVLQMEYEPRINLTLLVMSTWWAVPLCGLAAGNFIELIQLIKKPVHKTYLF